MRKGSRIAALRAGALLVAAGPAEGRVDPVLGDRVEQRNGLQTVARAAGLDLADAARVDRLLHRSHNQTRAGLGDAAVAELDRLREVVTGVDVHQRERQPRRPERTLREPQEHRGVLTAGEQQRGTLELGGDLADDVDRLGLERVEMC